MNKLKAARQRAGLSQEQLAQRAGLKQTTLSTYELGKWIPPRDVLLRIMSALGKGAPEDLGYRWKPEVGVEVDA